MSASVVANALTFRRADALILDSVTVTIGPATRIGVVGVNGSGKSTLLRLLAGELEPDHGSVRRTPPSATVGYLPQEVERLPGETVRQLLHRRTGVSAAEDALTRATLQETVMDIHATLKNTVLMITHDVDEAVLLSDRIIMMTNGPAATVGEDLAVKLPRPRKRLELANDPAYMAARGEVLRFLYDRFSHPEDQAA